MYLKQNNNFYHDTDIALDNIPRSLLSLTDNTNDQESDSSNLWEDGNKGLTYRGPCLYQMHWK